jgi:hypothetical protein
MRLAKRAATPPAAAERVVLTPASDPISAFLEEEMLAADPILKPYQPNHRMKVPSTWRATEWPGKVFGLASFFPALVEKASLAGSKNLGSNDGRYAAGHVDDSAAGKVNHAHTEERFGSVNTEETVVGPDTVHNDWINEAREHH